MDIRECVAQLSASIRNIEPRSTSAVVAIDGFGGSGKSTLATKIADTLGATLCVLDDFPYRASERPFHPLGTQTGANWQRFRDELLIPLLRDGKAEYRRSVWWESDSGRPEQIISLQRTPVIICEGLGLLRPELRHHYDLSIWIDCESDIGAERGIQRDGNKDWDRKVWEEIYKPGQEQYFIEHAPRDAADIVVSTKTSERYFLE